jgi:hypothetical protein
MSGLTGNVTVPRQTGAATAQWLANETTAITESDQVFSQMALSPKNVGAYTEVSRLLMLQSSPSAEMLVMNDLAAVVALAVDNAAINGTGTAGQPTGIVTTAGIGAVTGTSLAYSGVLEFQSDVLAANALLNAGAAGYVTTPGVAALLSGRARFPNTDTPLWEGSLLDGRVAGFRAAALAHAIDLSPEPPRGVRGNSRHPTVFRSHRPRGPGSWTAGTRQLRPRLRDGREYPRQAPACRR